MTAVLIQKPLEFSAFPTVLLTTTLYRLALNIAFGAPDPRRTATRARRPPAT